MNKVNVLESNLEYLDHQKNICPIFIDFYFSIGEGEVVFFSAKR